MEHLAEDQKLGLEDIKPDTVSITIIQVIAIFVLFKKINANSFEHYVNKKTLGRCGKVCEVS